MQVRIFVAAMGLAAFAAGSASADQVFATLAGFNAAVPNAVLNTFDGAEGATPMVSFTDPMGHFSYDISASFGGLSNNDGTVSTNFALASLVIEFTSGDVRAFGGEWWGTDSAFNEIPALITIRLDDNTVRTFVTDGPRFGGYLSDTKINSITISAFNFHPPAFPTMDNFRVAVVPLPPAAWAGLGMLGLMGGVRVARRRG